MNFLAIQTWPGCLGLWTAQGRSWLRLRPLPVPGVCGRLGWILLPLWFFSFSVSYPLSPSLVPFGVCGAASAVSTAGPGGVSKGPCRHYYYTRGLGARLLTGGAAEMWREAFHREPLLTKSPASRPLSTPNPPLSSLLWSSSTARPPPALEACLPSPPVTPLQLTPSRRVLLQTFPSSIRMHRHCFQRETKQKTSWFHFLISHFLFLCSTFQYNFWKELSHLVPSLSSTRTQIHFSQASVLTLLQNHACWWLRSWRSLLCSEHSRGPLLPVVLRATVYTALHRLPLPLCPPTPLPLAPSAAATPGTSWPFKAHSHLALVAGTLPPDGSLPHCLQVEEEDSRPWPPVAGLAPTARPWYSPPAHKQFHRTSVSRQDHSDHDGSRQSWLNTDKTWMLSKLQKGIITLNVNGLNAPIKDRVADRMKKQEPRNMLPTGDPP